MIKFNKSHKTNIIDKKPVYLLLLLSLVLSTYLLLGTILEVETEFLIDKQ